jgi:DNA repair exonuclease SbcCD ATPase subunit
MRLDSLLNEFEEIEQEVSETHKSHMEVQNHKDRLVLRLESLESNHIHCLEAHDVLRTSVEVMQTQVHHFLGKLVTRCLRSVLDDPYEFDIVFKNKRNSTEALLTFKRDGVVLEDPKASVGGGVLDLASFALRVGAICLSGNSRVIVMDEGFRFVSEKYREPVRQFMEKLSDELDFQFIQVTHSEELVSGRIHRLG